MKTYVSYSSNPGTQGKYFYNKFFNYYNCDSVYMPKSSSIQNIQKDLLEAKKKYEGISISMPFKSLVIKELDYVDKSVTDYMSCNTIINKTGKLHGYNTDVFGVAYVCNNINSFSNVCILGNGSIGRMFITFLTANKYVNLSVFSRSLNNWEQRHSEFDVVINCTGLGTIENTSPFKHLSDRVKCVIDMSINPNKLTDQARNINYVSGQVFYKQQFIKQFKLYTDIDIDTKVYDKFYLEK